MVQQPIKTGLAAFGMSGQVFHGPLLKTHPGFSWIATCERNSQKSNSLNPEIITVNSFEQLLKLDIDLVIINTPHSLHFEMATQALKANKHVVVEKPLTMSESEAILIYQLAQKQNLLLAVFQNRRFDSDFLAFQSVIHDGLVGDWKDSWLHFNRFRPQSNSFSWKESQNPDGGNLLNLGPHLIDQAIVLFGKPDWVQADIRKTRNGSLADDAFMIVLGYGVKRCYLSVNYHVAGISIKYEINGSLGSWKKYGADVQEDQLKSGLMPSDEAYGFEPKEIQGTFQNAKTMTITNTPRGFYPHFYDQVYLAIKERKPMSILDQEIILQHRIIDLAKRSSHDGKQIAI